MIHTEYILFKSFKDKGKENLESSKWEATCHLKGVLNKVNSPASSETMGARKQWDDIFEVMKGRKKKKPVNQEFNIQ